MIPVMARKTYSDEFRRQAVDLFESTPGATLKGIAADLGITRGALAQWVRVLGTGTTAPASPSSAAGPAAAASRAGSGAAPDARPARAGAGRAESPAARVARLEARVAELEAETAKLTTEREILRQAAKYFAGETNW
jgi:transposase